MAAYWLTFRIADEGDDNKRRSDLYDAIEAISASWWLEPTSFVLFDSNFDIDQIAQHVAVAIDAEIDLILLRSLNSQNARVIGSWSDTTLAELMPYVRNA